MGGKKNLSGLLLPFEVFCKCCNSKLVLCKVFKWEGVNYAVEHKTDIGEEEKGRLKFCQKQK